MVRNDEGDGTLLHGALAAAGATSERSGIGGAAGNRFQRCLLRDRLPEIIKLLKKRCCQNLAASETTLQNC
jgi:hypothetical protein